MDHVINSIMKFYEIEIDYLVEEWASGEYKKLSDCPLYASCKAMNDAIFTLEKYYYGERKTDTIQEEIKWRTSY
ncbi:hypothetical protein LG307_14675 [Sutcliffiella horikoshii]|uniref:hypothetical protein n=1 Tax=Sutcliffiella horikoshii TaxID=79883 RepID=UPI00384C3E2E